jgi:TolB protein
MLPTLPSVRRAIPLIAALVLAACGGGGGGGQEPGADIAFTVNDDGWGEIWLMAADGSDRTPLTDPEPEDNDASGASSPAWSPDGASIAFAAQIGVRQEDQSLSEVYVMSSDGTNQRRLTRNKDYDGDPYWSPDGKRIAFTRVTEVGTEAQRSGIVVMNADGGGAKQITRPPALSFDGTPAWSPDGSLIAFTRATFGRGSEAAELSLMVVAPDGTGLKRVVAGGGDPSWSPDGKRIAYSSIRDRFGRTCFEECSTSGEIHVVDADGESDRRLTRTKADEGSPAWSADGRLLAFVSDRSNAQKHENEIYVMSARGDDVRRITENDVWDLEPAWRPR